MTKKFLIYISAVSVGAFLIDRFIKEYVVRTLAPGEKMLGWRYFGIELYRNTGIAFSLPAPHWGVLIVSGIIIALVGAFAIHAYRLKHFGIAGLCCVLFLGALGNFIDRLFHKITIDYIRIWHGVFNLSDGMILLAIVMMFWPIRRAMDNENNQTKS